jgi:two-component system KDP operon response regulator KdpE
MMGTSSTPTTILLVDDDQAILDYLRAALRRQEYNIVLARDGEEAIEAAIRQPPDLVILDLSLPGVGGLQVCRELRTWYSAPILILSGHEEEETMVAALDSGADDYVTKPVRLRELLARVRSLLRRASERPANLPVWTVGEIEIDRARRHVFLAGKEIRFTRTEFDILAYLVQNLDCVVTLKMLMDRIWGPTRGDYAQTLRVHVGHIRKKMEADPAHRRYILTESGIGYRFTNPSSPISAEEKSA